MKYNGAFPVLYETIDQGQRIGDMANKLAYSGNPASARWKGGHPTKAYKQAIAEYHSYHRKSSASIHGASCDVFVCTCVRASGVDPNYPQGLWQQEKYLRNSNKFKLVTDGSLQDGDIIIYKKKGAKRSGHTCIYYKGMIKEANAKQYYGRTVDAVKTRLSMDGKKWVRVYRAVNTKAYKPLKYGSEGEQVLRWQRYLNCHYDKAIANGRIKRLAEDGKFYDKTKRRTIKFQNTNRLKPDGIAGNLTIGKAREVNQ